jgi:hypothetical protein
MKHYATILLCMFFSLLFFIPGSSYGAVPNDSCNNATLIASIPDTLYENTRLATADPNDPVLFCNSGTGDGKSVWFIYTADSTGYVTFSTRLSTGVSVDTVYDTTIGLFTGTCDALTIVACNDDITAGTVRTSQLTHKLTQGVTYLVFIGEWNGGGPSGGVPTGGNLVLTVNRAVDAYAVRGPAVGSWHGGTVLNTNNFTNAPFAKRDENELREAAENERPKLLPLPPGATKARAPKGSNYIEDKRAESAASIVSAPHSELDFRGFSDDGYIPPDVIMDVGPNHILAMVNSQFTIFDKSGVSLKNINCNTWYGSLLSSSGFSDPQVLYDHYAHRWIMGGISTSTTPNFIFVSVSDDDDPLGVWYNWAIPAGRIGDSVLTSAWTDHPWFGLDEQALYIDQRLVGYYNAIMIIPKAQLYQTNPNVISLTNFYDFRDPDVVDNYLDYMKPVVSWGAPGKGFVMGTAPYNIGTFVTLWTIDDPVGTPSITGVNIPVTEYLPPPAISQYGGGTGLENLAPVPSEKIIYRDSSLWMAHCVASGTNNQYAAISYLRINPFTYEVLEDVAFGKEGYWRFYPAIMANADKDLVIGFSETGKHTYAGAYFTGRHESDPVGLSASVPLKEGLGHYVKTYGGTRNRWGDYNGIGLDPQDSSHIWVHTEFADVDNNWGTWIGKITLNPNPTQLISVDHTKLHFGSYEVGSGVSDTVEVTVTNLGSTNLTISSIAADSNYLVYSNDVDIHNPIILPSYGSFALKVAFTPKNRVNGLDSIVITSDDPAHPHVAINVDGTSYIITKPDRGILFATSGNGGKVFTVNPNTGSAAEIGYCGYDKIVSSRIDPSTGYWVGYVALTGFVKISSSLGDAHPLAALASPGITAVKGMTFRGDTCYIASANGNIYRANPYTGEWTTIANCGFAIAGMDFNPLTGELWASVLSGSPSDKIYKISLPSGTATLVGRTGLSLVTQDILFDGLGNLYGISNLGANPSRFFSIDTTTGTATVIGSTGSSFVQSLAIIPDTLLGNLDFGLISSFTTKAETLLVHNPGTETLHFSGIILSDTASFGVTPASGTINSGDSLQLNVTFHPPIYGQKKCLMEIVFDLPHKYGAFFLKGSAYTPGVAQTSVTEKWNLVSVPITVPDLRKTTLYPTANSSAYLFDGMSYVAHDTLAYGTGYWMHFESDTTDTISGLLGMSDTFTVRKDWNLIGSITTPALASTITPLNTHIRSQVYGYGNGYVRVDTIVPGKGYWVKVDSAGKIMLHSSLAAAKTAINPVATALNSMNSFTFIDAAGGRQVLYFGKRPELGDLTIESFELPPVPPERIFDARYESNRSAEFIDDGISQEISIMMRSVKYPVTISWNVKNSGSTAWLKIDDSNIPLNSPGEYQLMKQPVNLSLKLTGTPLALPARYTLEQNYPNPFNPVTSIRYALPIDSKVSLKIYDVLGREVITLVDETQSAGFKSVTWKSVNSAGLSVPSGIYFYRIQAGLFTQTKKLVLIK